MKSLKYTLLLLLWNFSLCLAALCNINYQDETTSYLGSLLKAAETIPVTGFRRSHIHRSVTEICNSSDNGNEDSDDSKFPPIYKIRPNYWKKQQANPDLGREHIPEAVDKPVLDKGSHIVASEKSISMLDLGNSQDNPVLIGEDEQNKTDSEADLNDSHTNSTKSTTGLNVRQTSLDATISSSSIPQRYDVDYRVSRAKLGKSSALVTKTAHVERVCRPLKRKTRCIQEQIPDLLSQGITAGIVDDSLDKFRA